MEPYASFHTNAEGAVSVPVPAVAGRNTKRTQQNSISSQDSIGGQLER